MPAANTDAAASVTASVEIFGEKDAAGARWFAGDFTKYAPAEALIELRCLEADRVKNTRPAATPTRFFLRQRHHASTDIATPRGFRQIHKIDEHQPERRSASNPADDLSTVWIADENMQGHLIRISHRRIVEGVQPVADDPLGIRLRCAGPTRRMGSIRLLRCSLNEVSIHGTARWRSPSAPQFASNHAFI